MAHPLGSLKEKKKKKLTMAMDSVIGLLPLNVTEAMC
jgi:hypothetical protein